MTGTGKGITSGEKSEIKTDWPQRAQRIQKQLPYVIFRILIKKFRAIGFSVGLCIFTLCGLCVFCG
jgi:hypothetical protein